MKYSLWICSFLLVLLLAVFVRADEKEAVKIQVSRCVYSASNTFLFIYSA